MSNGVKAGLVLGGILLTAVVALPVYAHCGRCAASAKDMLKTMETGKLTLIKAVEAAEKHCKGKAVAAFCEWKDQDLHVNVICLVGDEIKTVEMDAKTGKVTKVDALKKLPEFHKKHAEEDKKAAASQDRAAGQAPAEISRTVEAGCGSCIFKMEGVQGCKLAVKIDGKAYLVTGADVDAHSAGLCSASKQAKVRGRLDGDTFAASAFELEQ